MKLLIDRGKLLGLLLAPRCIIGHMKCISQTFSGGSTLFSVCKICALVHSPVFLDIKMKLGRQKDIIITKKLHLMGWDSLWGVSGG